MHAHDSHWRTECAIDEADIAVDKDITQTRQPASSGRHTDCSSGSDGAQHTLKVTGTAVLTEPLTGADISAPNTTMSPAADVAIEFGTAPDKAGMA